MSTLLEISDDLRSLDQLIGEIASEGGDITQVEDTLNQWFGELGAQRDQKIDNYCALIAEMQLRSAARKEESERLMKRVKVDENSASFLKAKLKSFFEEHNIQKIETDRYRVSIAKNGGATPIEYTEPVERAPQEYQRRKVETLYDTDKVRAALDAGKVLPFAKLGERGTRLAIK